MYVHSSKRDEELEVPPPQRSSTGEQEDDVEIEIIPGERPDQRQNDPVDHEEVPVEPQEVVVEEDGEVEQQQAAPGEEIAYVVIISCTHMRSSIHCAYIY